MRVRRSCRYQLCSRVSSLFEARGSCWFGSHTVHAFSQAEACWIRPALDGSVQGGGTGALDSTMTSPTSCRVPRFAASAGRGPHYSSVSAALLHVIHQLANEAAYTVAEQAQWQAAHDNGCSGWSFPRRCHSRTYAFVFVLLGTVHLSCHRVALQENRNVGHSSNDSRRKQKRRPNASLFRKGKTCEEH